MTGSIMKRSIPLIVNGKAATDPLLRAAISEIGEQGYPLEIRVTWESVERSSEWTSSK